MSFTKFGKFPVIISSKLYFLFHPFSGGDSDETNVGLKKEKDYTVPIFTPLLFLSFLQIG